MRLINIYPGDFEVFDKNVDMDDHVFYQSHIPALKRMWNEQGSTFWLRFLVSFREFTKTLQCEKLQVDKDHEKFPICSHNIFLCMDFGFIHIHKMFLEGDFSSAKTLMNDIFILMQNLHLLPQLESSSSSLAYDPFYSPSTRASFRNLFGLSRDRTAILKVVINYPVYLKFGGAVLKLLRRWLSADDIPEEDLPNVNNKFHYWIPYDMWLKDDFSADYFESYIAKYWDNKLPAILLTPDIHNTFLHGDVGICTCENKKMVFFKNEQIEYHTIQSACPNHKDCHLKIIHNSGCENPQFCSADNLICEVSCETTIKYLRMKRFGVMEPNSCLFGENEESFFKHFEVYIEPCAENNCRNVGTLVESFDDLIETHYYPKDTETYYHSKDTEVKDVKDFVGGICDNTYGVGISSQVINSIKQSRKVEDMKMRLRGKLNKRNRVKLLHLFEDPDFRLKMVEMASKKFRRDLEKEAKECGCNDWKAHERDTCPGISVKDMHLVHNGNTGDVCVDIHSQRRCEESKNFCSGKTSFSVAVGTDDRSRFGKVIEPQKKKSKKEKEDVKTDNAIDFFNALKITTYHVSNDNKSAVPSVKNSTHKSTNETLKSSTSVVIIKDVKHSKNLCNNINKVDSKDPRNLVENIKHALENKCDLNYGKTPTSSKNKMISKAEETEISHAVCKITKVTHASENDIDHASLKKNVEDIPDAVDTLLSVLTMGRDVIRKETDVIQKAVTANKRLGTMDSVIKEKPITVLGKPMKKSKLHICVHCKQKETEPRTFKKCARCKAENFPEPRYYCTRQCQVEDWEESHRDEHLRNGNKN